MQQAVKITDKRADTFVEVRLVPTGYFFLYGGELYQRVLDSTNTMPKEHVIIVHSKTGTITSFGNPKQLITPVSIEIIVNNP